jgi:hypothetical protein
MFNNPVFYNRTELLVSRGCSAVPGFANDLALGMLSHFVVNYERNAQPSAKITRTASKSRSPFVLQESLNEMTSFGDFFLLACPLLKARSNSKSNFLEQVIYNNQNLKTDSSNHD